ncbi:hypothetical protein SADUNF_Sadunf16G0274600 [Salix dunnii]|uniref:Apple domain-containing protein n=1 Tax=Salix dunnii TaxID=1413687 RepID=A0A835JE48_9ROSI|nr:hypothetical protein SADUNF_Sadunf16G0274600 [Salix dunnii]
MRDESNESFRSGPWNGMRFSGTPQLKPNPIYTYRFVYDGDEEYYTYNLVNSSFLSRMVINQNGAIQRFTWIDRTRSWELYLSVQTDNCDRYALCGAYATCRINNSPVCGCLEGFTPNVSKDWDTMDWSSGCVRKTPLNCSGDGFRKFSGLKFPETRKSWFNRTMSLDECRSTCLKNCSCTAYANLDISINGGSGCLLWLGNLVDMRQINENVQEIYIRMAASDLGKKNAILETSQNNKGEEEDLKLPLFDISTMSRATNDFSQANILGEGGFGTVYQAWRLFTEGRSSELIAESIVESCNFYEVLRSMQIGLLCVQRSPRDRPSMSTVVMMLGSENELSQPKEPGFFTTRDVGKATSSSTRSKVSANEITMTQLEAR